jgi:hypothetical protein
MEGSEFCERLKCNVAIMSKAACRTKKAAGEEEGGTAKSMTYLLWQPLAVLLLFIL